MSKSKKDNTCLQEEKDMATTLAQLKNRAMRGKLEMVQEGGALANMFKNGPKKVEERLKKLHELLEGTNGV